MKNTFAGVRRHTVTRGVSRVVSSAVILAFKRYAIPVAIALIGIVFFEFIRGAKALDFGLHDIITTIRAQAAPATDRSKNAVFIAVDEESERELLSQGRAPIRAELPRLLEVLRQSNAAIVVFDFFFIDSMPEIDPLFREALLAFPVTFAGVARIHDELHLSNNELIDAFTGIGIINMEPIGGVPRFLAFDSDPVNADLLPISYVVAARYADEKSTAFPVIPRNVSKFWVPFNHSPEFFPSFSFIDVLESSADRVADERNTPLSIFSQKAIFVGYDNDLEDRYQFPNTLGYKIPGSYGHMFAFEALLSQNHLLVFPPVFSALISLFCVAASCMVFFYVKGRSLVFLDILYPVAWAIITIVLSILANTMVPVLPAFAGILLFRIVFRLNERVYLQARLKTAIGFDPAMLSNFQRIAAQSGGKVIKSAAILCSDIRDYTTYVKNNSRDSVALVVGEYMTAMEEIIIENRGYINKFVGDEIVAVFGFPKDESSACCRAILSALQMLAKLEELKKGWIEEQYPHFQAIGIGVDYGNATFLEIGGKTKRQFDIIGNPINGAARIQALTKEVQTPFLISKEARSDLSADFIQNLPCEVSSIGTSPIRGMGNRDIYKIIAED